MGRKKKKGKPKATDFSTVRLRKSTKRLLKKKGEMGDTFDDVIAALLREQRK